VCNFIFDAKSQRAHDDSYWQDPGAISLLAARAQEAGHPPLAAPGRARPDRRARLRARHRGGHRGGRGRVAAYKEAALFGTEPDEAAALRERVAREAPGEPVLAALRTIVASGVEARAAELAELGGDPADWLNRMKEFRTDPHLRAAQAAQMAKVERALVEGIAERLGTDPERDPYPGLLAAVVAGVFRSSLTFWAASGGTVPPRQLAELAFQALADGLPERCALRDATANEKRKDGH
jgi:hypothetical protein